MANRKLPFGYEMRRGEVRINQDEASVVKDIYTAYAEGASYRQLTERLNAQPIRYGAPNKSWNKNMVARILANGIYTGESGYPAILSEEERHRAVSAKPVTGAPLDPNQTVKAVRKLARCSVCSSALTLSANRFGWARWNCPTCAAITADAATPDILASVMAILAAIHKRPEIVQTSPPVPAERDDISQAVQESSEPHNDLEYNETAAKEKALALASARFNALGSEDYETMRIQYMLARSEPQDGLDTDLLRQIVSAILIHPNGAVSLRLKNNQIVERSDST